MRRHDLTNKKTMTKTNTKTVLMTEIKTSTMRRRHDLINIDCNNYYDI